MSFLDLFKKSNGRYPPYTVSESEQSATQKPAVPDIPEQLFIEKEQPPLSRHSNEQPEKKETSIELLFNFLDRNFESKGYDDALINPDSTNMHQNLDAIKNDFSRLVRRVKTYYEDFIREISFHIESRSRNGMIDTVDELTMKKEIAETHIQKVLQIEKDALENKGESQGVLISYTRGFKNGLAAISHHNIISRKL